MPDERCDSEMFKAVAERCMTMAGCVCMVIVNDLMRMSGADDPSAHAHVQFSSRSLRPAAVRRLRSSVARHRSAR